MNRKIDFVQNPKFVSLIHSNSKFRVFATEAFRSENSTESSDFSTEVSDETKKTFDSVSTTPKFLVKFLNFTRNFVISFGIFQVNE
jgi:hypothetical protein